MPLDDPTDYVALLRRSVREAVPPLGAQFNVHLAHVMAATPADVRQRERTRHNLHEISWHPVAEHVPTTLAYFMADYVAHLRHHVAQVLGAGWDGGAPGHG